MLLISVWCDLGGRVISKRRGYWLPVAGSGGLWLLLNLPGGL